MRSEARSRPPHPRDRQQEHRHHPRPDGRQVARETSDQQVTFLNNQGTQGLQFAAVGGTVYELAKAKGLGHPLPREWFLQDIRD